MFERTILLWPGIGFAVLAALVLIARPDRRGPSWAFDLLGGVGVAAGGLMIYESERDDAPLDIEVGDIFKGIFDSWPEALLVAVIAAAIVVVAVILVRRALPEADRVLAVSAGVITVIVASHLWSTGL